MAVPTHTTWQIADGLPTIPTLLTVAAAVVLAFIIGHATGGGGGGGSAAVATRPAATDAITTTTAPPATHTVGRGETLSSIANSYGVTSRDLASFNNVADLNHVFVGEVLKIPPPTTPTTAPTKAKH
jgi:LysM repeat protein